MMRPPYRGTREYITDTHARIRFFGGSWCEPAETVDLLRCPWCGDWHRADDLVCQAWPPEPPAEQITEEDLDDWDDWIGVAS